MKRYVKMLVIDLMTLILNILFMLYMILVQIVGIVCSALTGYQNEYFVEVRARAAHEAEEICDIIFSWLD